ncbi:cdc42 effector protein 2 [Cygnus atratus]|uniref:cdc42 effector protein 2 n=1 Tax=Cygnus atratus TaxID=8868 RepID=UPI0015D65400|nr:cdc42 effector protein 2 [Cygnus atratus]XP_035428115.1 cdc42 effector protein 2 [Cygnus atratus]XP_050572925.1 cdc42 effector protein 2 [Cygnus atratus]
MSTKAPIYLKRGSRKGKRAKLRDVLSCDMISPPLGDFRHTIHVGSGGEGDTFGDVSFLRGKFHLLPRAETASASSFQFARTSTLGERPASEAASPLLKNAVSLPVLGAPQALTLPAAPAPPKPPRLHLDERVGLEEEEEEERGAEPFLPHAGSLLSLHVDLGPSILEDVLQVMERHQAEGSVQILT